MNKYYYMLPLLYVIVVLILLTNYIFESTKISFSWGLLSIQLSANDAEKTKALHDSKTLSLENTTISYAKILLPQASFAFNTYASISSNRENGILSSIAALPSGDGFILSFGDKTFVSFQTNLLAPEEISIIVYAQPQDTIRLPMSLPLGINTTYKENSLEFTRRGTNSRVLASSQASFIKSNNKSWLLSSRSAYASFHFSAITTNTPPTITKIPILPPITMQEAEQSVSEYIDKAYTAWTTSRFNTALGTWVQPEGFFGFSEQVLISTYTEALYREELPQFKIALYKASILNKQALSWRSASFAYDGAELILSLKEEMLDTQRYVLAEINSTNRSMLYNFSLWELVPLWKNADMRDEFFAFIQQVQPLNHAPEAAAMLLYQSVNSPWTEFTNYIASNNKLFEQNLLNHTVVANEGYMLLDSHKTLNVLYSIIAGRYLMYNASQDSLKLLGARMLHTALSLADKYAYLPRIFSYKNSEYNAIGTINPESIYSIISDNPYYPRIQASSTKDLFYLASTPLSIVKAENSVAIVVNNLMTDLTQYVYCWPIEKPEKILAFDVEWSGRAFPSSLSQGVSYNAANELLTIKMLGRNQTETITLIF